tara:strand:- start:2046 stop:2519 length:474 start_codon:yes stop_codon:yes gene_type:complete
MKNKKKFDIDTLLNNILSFKRKDLIIGFTNGCFDLLHNGHLKLLLESKKKCDYLIVGLNSDTSIKSIKGSNRPIDCEAIRITKLSGLEEVDAIIVFSEENPLKLIKKINPNILFKGSDYNKKDIIGNEFVVENGGEVVLIDILDGYSTTNTINNLNK